MSFTLQKITWFLVMPPACLIVFMLFGVLVARNRVGLAKGFLLVSALVLYLLSLGPIADLLLMPLERSARPLVKLPRTADAVVVPGGGSVDRSWVGAAPIPNGETYTRLVLGVEVAKKLKIPLILTGGNGEPFATKLKDAEVMAEAAYAMGLPRTQIVVEKTSRNTLENSLAVRKLLKGNRIILATSAYYMKRAVIMFSRQGFTVIPAPTYYLSQTRQKGAALFIPRAENLKNSGVGLAEWLSLAWWKMRGEL
ncbi:MAG: YdcF family protein [Geobacteraceae bacterium]